MSARNTRGAALRHPGKTRVTFLFNQNVVDALRRRAKDAGDGGAVKDGRAFDNGGARPRAWLVYDGGCPICKRYVQHLDVKEDACELALVNARNGGALVEEIDNLAHDMNDGIVLKMEEGYHFGGDAFHVLARLSTGKGIFGFVNRLLFRSRRLARLAYPPLVFGRRMLLRLLNIPPC